MATGVTANLWPNASNDDNLSTVVVPPCAGDTPELLSAGAKCLAVLVYMLITVLAFGGNALVVYLVLHFKRLRTPTNLLILNLAVADLLMAVFCVPFTFWSILIIHYWPFGALLCVLIHFAQTTSVMLSSYTLVAISVDQCLAISFPLKLHLRLTHAGAGRVIAVVWAVSVLIATPVVFAQRLIEFDGQPQCMETWSERWGRSYGHMLLALQYVLPLGVLLVTYGTGVSSLCRSGRMPAGGQLDAHAEARAKDRKDSVHKMVFMMVLVSFLYAACWLPQNLLMNIILAADPCIGYHPKILYIYWAVHVLAMSHSFVNPIIYCWKNRRFRAGFVYSLHFTRLVKFEHRHLNELQLGSSRVGRSVLASGQPRRRLAKRSRLASPASRASELRNASAVVGNDASSPAASPRRCVGVPLARFASVGLNGAGAKPSAPRGAKPGALELRERARMGSVPAVSRSPVAAVSNGGATAERRAPICTMSPSIESNELSQLLADSTAQ